MAGTREIRLILAAYAEASARGARCALATVVNVEGSSYRRPGARMLLTDDGQIMGCVSGGCLERDLVQRAGVLRSSAPPAQSALLIRYDTRDDLPEGELSVGLGCNGLVDIWLELLPLDGKHTVLGRLGELLREKRAGAVVVRNAEGAELLTENFSPPTPWVLFGAGQDAIPMARFASELGWEVTVVDCRSSLPMPRASFAEIAEHVTATPETACAKVELSPATCAIVMTHNFDHDLEILARLIPSPARYIGMLGPRKRAERLLSELASRGLRFTDAQLARLHAPVGLDIGAETPEEIALSVVAEVRARLSDRAAIPLRERAGPIHERGVPGTRPPAPIATYLLAAGESRRMGRPKQLLDWKGRPLVVHAATQAAEAGLAPVHVVRGANAEAVTGAFEGRSTDVRFIDNPRWASGSGSSVKAAIADARASGAGAALLLACDQPLLTAASLRKLARAYEEGQIAAAAYAGTVGIPAIFPAKVFDELLELPDDHGAKGVLEKHRGELTAVTLREAEHDVDTPEDYTSASAL